MLIFSILVMAHVWFVLTALSLRSDSSPSVRATAAVVILGLASYAVFLAYVISPAIGKALALALIAAPVLAAVPALRRPGGGQLFVDLNVVAAPTLLLAVFVLWIGLYPFTWDGLNRTVPARRWRDMPVDNWISFLFANMVAKGKIVRPMIGDWLSSDRPPLQAGLYLMFKGVLPGSHGIGYQAISTWAQTLLLIPIGQLIPSTLRRTDRMLMLATLGLSALVILNSLFVWPKLVAAAYCAIYHLLLFRSNRDPGDFRVPLAAGFAAALALLAHGGAFFALAGSTIARIVLRGAAPVRDLAIAAIGCAALYAPWLLYQRLLDPPGNRMQKWHLGGQIAVDNASFTDTLIKAYASIGASQWLADRKANVSAMFDGTFRFFADANELMARFGSGSVTERMIQQSSSL